MADLLSLADDDSPACGAAACVGEGVGAEGDGMAEAELLFGSVVPLAPTAGVE